MTPPTSGTGSGAAAASTGATYDATALATSTLYATRFIIGDTIVDDDTAPAYFLDSEITYELANAADTPTDAAIALLERLATRYRQKANISAGHQSIQLGALADGFAMQADRLRERSATYGAIGVIDTNKIDGYSDNISALDTTGNGSGQFDAPFGDSDHPYVGNYL